MRRRSSESLVEPIPRKRANIREANGPTKLRSGDVLTDVAKKQWRLGKSVGSGAFGKIYLASDSVKETVKPDAEYVAKVEPHDSGPLFVEMNCYLRAAKLEMIQSWLEEKNIQEIGMPHYVAFGSHSTQNDRYRFLILPRYGTDLDTIFKMKNKKFNMKTVLTISIQILDILEYLHSKGYVHSDIKGSNLMLGHEYKPKSNGLTAANNPVTRTKSMRQNQLCSLCNKKYSAHNNLTHKFVFKRQQSANQIYLLDYGLASKFLTSDGVHKEYCCDQRKAHAGTIQFCSRDAHCGCTARRSDLENLGYNMLYWLTAKLPWDDVISNPEEVNTRKCEAMLNLEKFLYNLLGDSFPSCIYEYLKYVKKLSFKEEPDYNYCRKLFCKGLLEYGYKNDNYLDFDRSLNGKALNKEIFFKKVKKQSENLGDKDKIQQKFMYDRKPLGINSQVMLVRKPTLRSSEKKRELRRKKFSWAKVLSSDPENILRQYKKQMEKDKEVSSRSRKNTENSITESNVLNIDLSRLNPTYAMIDVVNKAQERNSTVLSSRERDESLLQNCDGYTAAMKTVLNRKITREKEEKETLSKKSIPTFKMSLRQSRSKCYHPLIYSFNVDKSKSLK